MKSAPSGPGTALPLREWKKSHAMSSNSTNQINEFYLFLFLCRITAKIDDDMLSYYCNEDTFLLEVRQLEEDLFDITLTELSDDINGK